MGALDLPAPRSAGRAALAAPLVPGLWAQDPRPRLWHARALQAAAGHGRAPSSRAAERFASARADSRVGQGARAGGPPDRLRPALFLPGNQPRHGTIALRGGLGGRGSARAGLLRRA